MPPPMANIAPNAATAAIAVHVRASTPPRSGGSGVAGGEPWGSVGRGGVIGITVALLGAVRGVSSVRRVLFPGIFAAGLPLGALDVALHLLGDLEQRAEAGVSTDQKAKRAEVAAAAAYLSVQPVAGPITEH